MRSTRYPSPGPSHGETGKLPGQLVIANKTQPHWHAWEQLCLLAQTSLKHTAWWRCNSTSSISSAGTEFSSHQQLTAALQQEALGRWCCQSLPQCLLATHNQKRNQRRTTAGNSALGWSFCPFTTRDKRNSSNTRYLLHCLYQCLIYLISL